MGKKYGFSFSWKKALGISSAKQKIARATGIPTTKSGRQRKVGRMLGCLIPTLIIILMLAMTIVVFATK
jgi:hypothetical protein